MGSGDILNVFGSRGARPCPGPSPQNWIEMGEGGRDCLTLGGADAPPPIQRWGVETCSAFSEVLFLDLSTLPGVDFGEWEEDGGRVDRA